MSTVCTVEEQDAVTNLQKVLGGLSKKKPTVTEGDVVKAIGTVADAVVYAVRSGNDDQENHIRSRLNELVLSEKYERFFRRQAVQAAMHSYQTRISKAKDQFKYSGRR